MPLIEKDVDMIWDDAAKEKFESGPLEDYKVQDHFHFTGEFRGSANQHCNLEYKIDKGKHKLPVVFHNPRGYEAHLIFQKVK